MKVLGIESTAHTIGIGVAEKAKGKTAILANKKSVFKAVGKGFVPTELAEHHAANFETVLSDALSESGSCLAGVDAIAYSKGPGIGTCLRVGATAACYLSARTQKPVVGVNHCLAHVEIAKWQAGLADPLVIYVSGGNTQLVVKEDRRYHVIGETLDIGAGNLFDSFARSLKLEHPIGSELEKLATGGKYLPMPYSLKAMNFTFSGLQTYAEKLIGKYPKNDIAYSLMETSFSMICEGVEKALTITGKKELIACGGVACNKRLQEMLSLLATDRGITFGAPSPEFNVDNGAMVAFTGAKLLECGFRPETGEIAINQDYRIDQAKLPKNF
ncbi:UGMP family protein [Candidatus Micrarchaeota archaeon CG08_land_8_20_14_0_20_49_17]|nr:MAG: hypothetical protein AUJ13_01815 [Candidatus Micrarchaeota archaeon CG1_02_49_24]PIU10013.1 MAG: UGMP family protein [Candidatus Micrarchaeota archaeon CG08_land_8_20_14_0_20_49_17]PIZ95370.1 MAG: UGMP family protein [Candidatus Micrarchaeota archaeon CG_4_10_14_0_2_um_filter_49_7]HII53632.1 tRNA (adenosine(37)-N6)-threonylcarbamoyltransferase complex transferase subunit TsaD [Candidatus Micrarchaeota archaeon]